MTVKFRGNEPVRPSPELLEALRKWQLPNVQEQQKPKQSATNALGMSAAEPKVETEIEVEIPKLPTADEVEAIRAEAYQDGFNEGKEAGAEVGQQEGFEAGKTEGFEQGKAEGYQQGFQAGEEAVEALQQQWQDLIEMLHTPLKTVDENAEKQLLSMVSALAEAVIGCEIKQQPDIILHAIKSGVDMLAHEKQAIEIVLNPEDMLIVQSKFDEEFMQEHQWRLIADPTVERAGCIVRNPSSVVDLTLKNRLTSVMESFLQGSGIESES